ncbi:hypothetical protein [Methylocystis sp.]|uniref:hypothetical protein n=1 Tax=Methylocystis sp. TaxID=1911079 RepID=UPI0025CECDCA|nr:hypothetical protein [Methylocystis sp.]
MTIVFEESGVEARIEKNGDIPMVGADPEEATTEAEASVGAVEKAVDAPMAKADRDEAYFEKMAFVAECVEVRRFLKMPPWLSEVRDEEDAGSQWGRLYHDLEIDERVLAIARIFPQRPEGWEEAASVLIAYLDLRENSIDPLVGIARALCGDGARTG